MKKWLSFALALVMALALCSISWAEEPITTSEQLKAAIAAANDGDTITLGEGSFSTYGNPSPKKSLTFVGAGAKTVWTIGDLLKNVSGEGNGDYSFDGCDTITFKKMTLKTDGADYRGFIRINKTVVEECTLEGKSAYWGYQQASFINATFNAPADDYALWDYSSAKMTFDGCTFNISGKGVNVYVEAGNAGEAVRTVEVKDCTVNSTKANKAFLNIKNSTQAYDIVISGNNTVTGLGENEETGSALYQMEKTGTEGKAATVSVGGNKVWENGEKVEQVPEQKPSSGYYYKTPAATADEAKGSPKTFDAGVALYAAMALASLTGLAYTAKKRGE